MYLKMVFEAELKNDLRVLKVQFIEYIQEKENCNIFIMKETYGYTETGLRTLELQYTKNSK